MDNKEIIEAFYSSFAKGDIETMVSFYDDAITFHDPAFGLLKGNDVRNMWRMLHERSKGEMKIIFNNIQANDKTGKAHWQAEYNYSRTGRKVINKIDASFEFNNGKIIKHTDKFNLWKWAQQALGWKGYLLGWTSFLQNKIQQQTHSLLDAYSKRKNR